MRLPVLPAAVLALLLVAAPTAQAADVYVQEASTALVYKAAAGERNDVTITQDGTTFTITDPGATLNPTSSGTGPALCSLASPGVVTCAVPDGYRVKVKLGDGDDAVAFAIAAPADITGGA